MKQIISSAFFVFVLSVLLFNEEVYCFFIKLIFGLSSKKIELLPEIKQNTYRFYYDLVTYIILGVFILLNIRFVLVPILNNPPKFSTKVFSKFSLMNYKISRTIVRLSKDSPVLFDLVRYMLMIFLLFLVIFDNVEAFDSERIEKILGNSVIESNLRRIIIIDYIRLCLSVFIVSMLLFYNISILNKTKKKRLVHSLRFLIVANLGLFVVFFILPITT